MTHATKMDNVTKMFLFTYVKVDRVNKRTGVFVFPYIIWWFQRDCEYEEIEMNASLH